MSSGRLPGSCMAGRSLLSCTAPARPAEVTVWVETGHKQGYEAAGQLSFVLAELSFFCSPPKATCLSKSYFLSNTQRLDVTWQPLWGGKGESG